MDSSLIDLLDTSSSDLSSAMTSPSPPSSPLSMLSHSPSPPPTLEKSLAYPSPPSSQQTSQSGSPTPDGMDEKDGPPPAKRRRVSKERTRKNLDLQSCDVTAEQQPQLESLLRVLHKWRKIVVIAGAGISVSAGSASHDQMLPAVLPKNEADQLAVPDFRSSTGLFNSLKSEHKLKGSGKDLFDASVYKDESSTTSFHSMVSSMSRMTKDAKPTAFHHMLASLANEGRLLRLYSQNVDGIDTGLEPLKTEVPLRKDDKGKWPKTVQLHGGLDKMVCSKCHLLSDLDADLFDGPTAPPCPTCEEINDIRTNMEGKRSHGIGRLRPRMVLYNEHNPDDEAIGAVTREDLRRRPDAVIVVGTTLKVPGVKRFVGVLCNVVRDRKDGVAVCNNNDPPPSGPQFEDCWDIVVNGPADEVANLAAMRHWNDPLLPVELTDLSDGEMRRAEEKGAEVGLPPLKSIPDYLLCESLPSAHHCNNSFLPPNIFNTPKRPRASPDYSPMPARQLPVVLPSIESLIEDETIVVASGLLTPSKSSKGTPPKPCFNIRDKRQTSSKPAGKPTAAQRQRAPPKKKQSNVKYIKPGNSKSKLTAAASKTKSQQAAVGGLSNLFKSAKTSERQSGKDLVSTPNTPSKPRSSAFVTDNVPEPMHPLSPQNARNNKSPNRPRAVFPGLTNLLENNTSKDMTAVMETLP